MSDEEKFIITVRFPAKKPYGIKYLFVTGIIPFPEWPNEDPRWMEYTPMDEVVKRFIDWYKGKIKPDFDGEVLFVEPAEFVIANGKKS